MTYAEALKTICGEEADTLLPDFPVAQDALQMYTETQASASPQPRGAQASGSDPQPSGPQPKGRIGERKFRHPSYKMKLIEHGFFNSDADGGGRKLPVHAPELPLQPEEEKIIPWARWWMDIGGYRVSLFGVWGA